jgi:hypothetical protein
MKPLFNLFVSFVAIYLLLGQTSSLLAQSGFKSGYILTSTGDTLRGFLADEEEIYLSQRVEFRATKSAAKVDYLPSEIKGYAFENGATYLSAILNLPSSYGPVGKPVFLELIENGPIKLYTLHRSANKTGLILQKGAGPLEPLFRSVRTKQTDTKTQQPPIDTILNEAYVLPPGDYILGSEYKRVIAAAIVDKKGGFEVATLAFQQEKMIKEIRAYNSTMTGGVGVPQKKKNEMYIYIGAGYIRAFSSDVLYSPVTFFSKLEFPAIQGFQFKTGYSNTKISKNIIFDLNLVQVSNSAKGARTVTTYNPSYTMSTRFRYIELSARYQFFATKVISPYAGAGISLGRVKFNYTETDPAFNYSFVRDRNETNITPHISGGLQGRIGDQHVIYAGINSTLGSKFGTLPALQFGYMYRFLVGKK